MTDITHLRTMAAAGMTRKAIAAALDVNVAEVNRILRQHGIRTKGTPGVVAQPKDDTGPIHGCSGKQPHKLMPSADAVRANCVWGLAGHAPTVFRSPNEVITNGNENQSSFRKASSWTA